MERSTENRARRASNNKNRSNTHEQQHAGESARSTLCAREVLSSTQRTNDKTYTSVGARYEHSKTERQEHKEHHSAFHNSERTLSNGLDSVQGRSRESNGSSSDTHYPRVHEAVIETHFDHSSTADSHEYTTASTTNEKDTAAQAQSSKPSRSGATARGVAGDWTKKKFALADFQLGQPLGKGRFGSVYLARTVKDKRLVAIKVLFKEQLRNANLSIQLKREIEIHHRVRHENVVRLYAYFHDQTRVFLVLEYAPNGELFTAMRNSPGGRFTEARASIVMRQLCLALRRCHKFQVVHRDIKPENVLMGKNFEAKLADFGWSVNNVTSEDMKRETLCGTVDYVPPEMVQQSAYNESVDVWMSGVLMYEMLTGKAPFASVGVLETYDRVEECKVIMPSYVSESAQDLLKRMLVKDPKNRLPVKQILQHPWINKWGSYDDYRVAEAAMQEGEARAARMRGARPGLSVDSLRLAHRTADPNQELPAPEAHDNSAGAAYPATPERLYCAGEAV